MNIDAATFLESLAKDGGYIVSSNECSEMEIAFARAEDRMFVDDNGLGYIRRPRAAKKPCDTSETKFTPLLTMSATVLERRGGRVVLGTSSDYLSFSVGSTVEFEKRRGESGAFQIVVSVKERK